ncbi:glycosyltransferase family 2 protein [Desulfitobacterium hafniense]|nr:glycosyltransferase family 2 protein [Desulfitobacterium hafniense]
MNCTVFLTIAYNAESTLPRTIESVLSQTEPNWVWYLLDNGAKDRTGEIIKGYAAREPRIIPLVNKENHVYEPGNSWRDIIKYYEDADFLCWLDADDEYKPNFLRRMLDFSITNNLDVAACGSDFIDTQANRLIDQRILPQNLIVEDEGFGTYFTVYHQFVRTYWAKLFSISTLRKYDPERLPSVAYGWDTIFTQEMVRNANRFGILAESLHEYYIFPKSRSHQWKPKRIESDRILYDMAYTFLIDKCGTVSVQNSCFLYHIYFNAIGDTLSVLLNAEVDFSDKTQDILDILQYEKTQILFERGYVQGGELDRRIRRPILNWLFAKKECRTLEGAKKAAQIIGVMYHELSRLVTEDGMKYLLLKMPEMIEYLLQKDYVRMLERLQIWFKRHDADILSLTKIEIFASSALHKPDEEIFALFINIRKNRPQSYEVLNIDKQIVNIIEKYPLLKGISADFAATFSGTIYWVMKSNYSKALNAFLSINNVEINDEEAEAYFLFGQNLSAAAENVDTYIYFKKIWISYLLNSSRKEEAKRELDEFEQLLPEDEDFVELRKRL